MSAASTYLENKLLDHVLNNTSYTSPTDVWIALFTADGGLEGGTLTNEVSGGAYARVQVGSTTPNFSAASGGSTSNDAAITFPTATASWGTISHVAIMDASTAGNVLFHGALASTVAITTDDIFEFATGDLVVTLD